MLGNITLTLISVAVGCVILAIIAYYVIRFMRGSIKLSLPRTAFNPGDTITGSFDLQAKKAIQGNKLIVSLIGVQITEYYEDGKKRTRKREIYRDEVVIEETKAYPAGHASKHKFKIATPNTGSSEFMNSGIGQAITGALRLLSDRRTRLKWKVEARLDAKGVDLAASKSVSINIRPLV
jgi:hypothetical protein